MHKQCFNCDIKQVYKIKDILALDSYTEEKLLTKVHHYLKTCDMNKTNPEIMGYLWKIITKEIHNNNPYKQIKHYYNTTFLNLQNAIYSMMNESFEKALKISILGNLIDFSARDTCDIDSLMDKINNVNHLELAIDDSLILYQHLTNAKTVLYIGDNCGEIVLDKLFIRYLKTLFPTTTFYYGVRGFPIVNDVTVEDAKEVSMDEVAEVISNGDISLGTVLEKTSQEFQTIYKQSDIVICKGQGNYEGLMNTHKKDVYFLFMSKCSIIANPLHLNELSIVCMKNKRV